MTVPGIWLKLQRVKYRIKAVDLAKQMGVDQSYISKMEHGVVPVTQEAVTGINILAGLGTSNPDYPNLIDHIV